MESGLVLELNIYLQFPKHRWGNGGREVHELNIYLRFLQDCLGMGVFFNKTYVCSFVKALGVCGVG